jgi:hypothetical protein
MICCRVLRVMLCWRFSKRKRLEGVIPSFLGKGAYVVCPAFYAGRPQADAPKPTIVNVVIERPSTGEKKSINLEFDNDRYMQREIGWLEGWAFKTGDTVRLSSGDYKPRTVQIE